MAAEGFVMEGLAVAADQTGVDVMVTKVIILGQ